MRCPSCRADVLLGSAQCWRCGASMLQGTAPPKVAAPAPTSPPVPPRGFAPPPPPPLGWQPPMPGSARRRRRGRADMATLPGCACIVPVVVLALALPLGAALVGFLANLGGSVDGDGVQDEGRLVIGEPAEGGIGAGDADRWQLAGASGEVVVSVHGVDGFDPTVEVREIGGASLGTDDDSGPDRDAQLVVRLREGAAYEVEVREFGDDEGGDYTVTVSPTGSEGGSLTVRRPVAGSVGPDRRVRYTFVGESREVTITVRGRGGFDPTVTVLDPAGTQLAFNDDAIGRDAQVALTVPGGQTVAVEVAGFGGEGGDYTVEVA